MLEGAGIGGVTAVRFGSAEAAIVEVIDYATIVVVVPPHPEGSVSIEVTTTAGVVVVPDLFRYGAANSATPPWATLIEPIPDPAIVYDPAVRAAIVATGWAWKVADAGTGIELVLVPQGFFEMGCSASLAYGCSTSESPVHGVFITQPFYMSRTEITQAQWSSVIGVNPSFHQGPGTIDAANRLVEQVSFEGVRSFLTATGMRLPTEAEWEYACRAGRATAFHGWGAQPAGTNDDTLVGSIAWYSVNSGGQTRPVGGKSPNGFGLHDMSGNVWEWVGDWYSGSYYAASTSEDPQGPSAGSARGLRGGSWNNNTFNLRASNRFSLAPLSARNDVGFRVVRSPS